MANVLKQYFPMIRGRDEVRSVIRSRTDLRMRFEKWNEMEQEEFLDICTGVKGVKILYDSFFKAIMDPDIMPERLEEVISLVLEEKVKILKVLPNDSARIAAESSLLIMDIVVELKDGSIANVEVQRMGYAFPGQRSACYSADLLLRQYKRVKGEKGKKFSYRDIKKVYTIIFFEKSAAPFHEHPEVYLHHMKQKSDTGVELELLQEFSFVCLDIFRKNQHNKSGRIENRLEAWLTFLSVDDPEMIVKLLKQYPEFEALYREVYNLCRNLEDMMGLFSEELAILDENTVQYMIDEMQDVIDSQQLQLAEKENVIDGQKNTIDEQENMIAKKENIINRQQIQLTEKEQEIERLKSLLENVNRK